ncbi:MAG: hypothetical protein ACYC3L_00740 [Gemmatimonadaceae bacterium]
MTKRGWSFVVCIWAGGWCEMVAAGSLAVGASRLAQVAALAGGLLLGAAVGIFATTHPEGG